MNLAFKKTKKQKNLNNLKPTFYLNVWRKIGNDISYYMIYILVGHAPFIRSLALPMLRQNINTFVYEHGVERAS